MLHRLQFSFFFLLHGCDPMLVAENNKYYNQYLDALGSDDRHSQLPDGTILEIMYPWLVFFGHNKSTGLLLNSSFCHFTVL
jgi:hypothetical protein